MTKANVRNKYLIYTATIIIVANFLFLLFTNLTSKLSLPDNSLDFSNPVIEFPNASLGDTLKPDFIILNKGDKTVKLFEVIPDCDCTLINNYEKIIEPRDSIHLIASFVPQNKGIFLKKIKIEFNSENSPAFVIFRGNVK